MATKKLKRSKLDRMISDVAAGIGECAGIDPTAIRVLFVLSGLFGGTGLILYIVCLILMPDR